jgi:hypothetical protein
MLNVFHRDGEMIRHFWAALVCGMNLDILCGLAGQLPLLRITPRLDPAPGRCCVRFGRLTRVPA